MTNKKMPFYYMLFALFCCFFLNNCVNNYDSSETKTSTTPYELDEASGEFPLYTSEQQPVGLDGYFDIDNHHEYAEIKGDVLYAISESSELMDCLGPVNGAKMFIWGYTEPSEEDCRNIVERMNDDGDCSVEIGKYYCLLTNENSVARLYILSRDESYDNIPDYGIHHIYMIRIKYLIWYK